MRAGWDEAWLRQHEAKRSRQTPTAHIEAALAAPALPATKPNGLKPKVDARRGMNGLESEFALYLEARKQADEIVWYAFEPFRIRLANGCFYRPDFASVDKVGRTTMYECKGHMREAARLRLRVATEKLPYEFYLVRKVKGALRVSIV